MAKIFRCVARLFYHKVNKFAIFFGKYLLSIFLSIYVIIGVGTKVTSFGLALILFVLLILILKLQLMKVY